MRKSQTKLQARPKTITCIDCQHWDVDLGWAGSDVTPGDPPRMECNKSHWYLCTSTDSREEYRKCLHMAQKCPDFELEINSINKRNPKNIIIS
jgi:hypothetical protein